MKTSLPLACYEACAKIPNSPVVMYQTWKDLLFLHWEFPAEEIQKMLPENLVVDCYDGKAYVAIVPFFMVGVRPRYFPSVPFLSDFAELNLRTYVFDKRTQIPGVWFFTLDAHQFIAVQIAQRLFGLPYFYSKFSTSKENDTYKFLCVNSHPNTARAIGNGSNEIQPHADCEPSPKNLIPAVTYFEYTPVGILSDLVLGSLESFLLDRYVLYNYASGCLYKGHVHHKPFQVQPVDLHAFDSALFFWYNPKLAEFVKDVPPVNILFTPGQDVTIYWFTKI